MINQILADYYEEKGLIKKAQRLRKRNILMLYCWYGQYNSPLYKKCNHNFYGYSPEKVYFSHYGDGVGYVCANGWTYR